MTRRPRAEGGRERVAKAGPWKYDHAFLAIVPAVKRWDATHIEGVQAATRLLNRLSRKRRKL